MGPRDTALGPIGSFAGAIQSRLGDRTNVLFHIDSVTVIGGHGVAPLEPVVSRKDAFLEGAQTWQTCHYYADMNFECRPVAKGRIIPRDVLRVCELEQAVQAQNADNSHAKLKLVGFLETRS